MSEQEALREVVQRYWGYGEFLPLQEEAMASVLSGRDSLVVLPTGGGKSLCFQAPALVGGEGLAVVASPLIALMKDQVDALNANGVSAAYFNSSLTPVQQRRVAQRLREGRYRLLYASPERLVGEAGPSFQALLAQCGVRYVAVDEAHCISQWGHDFRPEYRQLGRLREALPGVSIHAFTATATERVQRDICDQLGLVDPQLLVGSFDRPNLVYRALHKSQVRSQVRAVLSRHAGEAGIIYCISRREVERLAAALAADGHRAVPYHAGLADDERQRNQDAFRDERVDVVVATVAFGMGIDRSNVRYVLHVGAPKSLEHYQQESGRAGRDGLEAECVLLYSVSDFITWRRMLEASGELSPAARQQLREMERFAAQTRCRHRALVEYFGQSYDGEGCGACDWCLGELELEEEPVVLAQKILSCVLRVRQSYGMGHVIDVLRGRDTEKVRSRGHHRLSTFALLEDCSVGELRGYIEQLLDQGFLEQQGDRYPVLAVPPEARPLLKGEIDCTLYRHQRPLKRGRRRAAAAGAAAESWEGVDRELFEVLRQLRLEIARQRGVPPYVIFHDTVLRHLARELPSDRQQLLAIPGIGEAKAADPGPRFLEAIARHREAGTARG